jgi:methylmalonyl-CoA mutase
MTDAAQAESRERLLGDFPASSYEAWREAAEALLKGAPFERRLLTRTPEGITLQPIYHGEDVEGVAHVEGVPGRPPYVRGTGAGGYARQPWRVTQELPHATADAFNEAVRADLERGQTAVALPLDRATRLGLDPDAADPEEVGAGGVSVATLDELARALDGIDLGAVPLRVTAGAAGLPVLGFLVALARRRGTDPARLRGILAADPLGELARRGTLPGSLEDAWNQVGAALRWASEHAPHLRVAEVDGAPYADGGSSAVEELAFVVASGVEYLRAMRDRDLDVDRAARRLGLSFRVGSSYFMEVAKLRAARLLWARVVKAFGGDAESQKVEIHARTAFWNKTVLDPWVNLLRTTTEAFAAVVGGTDSLHVGFFDGAVRAPDGFSRRMARNIQLILREECHLARVADPGGGSWFVESLTDELARESWSLFQEVEAEGGMAAALAAGLPQERVAATARTRRERLATRRDVLVGINRYANPDETPLGEPGSGAGPSDAPAPPPPEERARVVVAHRDGRGGARGEEVAERLAELPDTAGDELVEAAARAAAAGATVGELSAGLRGDVRPSSVAPVEPARASEPFEELRRAVDARVASGEGRPRVFLANLGPVSRHKPRADFTTGFMQVGGFEVLGSPGFDGPEAAARAALESGAPVVAICSTDDDYREAAAPLTRALKEERPDTVVVLAGRPEDQVEALREAGVDEFIHVRADIHDFHARLLRRLGLDV